MLSILISNCGYVLTYLSRDPEARQQEIAKSLGVDLRTVQRAIDQLEEAGYLLRTRSANHNRYVVMNDMPLDGLGLTVGEFLSALGPDVG
jgi:DNA-binding Lrp family transcriptional regulator